MERKMTWNNFYGHSRFWRHFGVWTALLLFLLINLMVSRKVNEGVFTEDLTPLVLFILEIFVMIYASFYAYNKLIPKKKYKQFFGSLFCIIIVIAFIDDRFQVNAMQIGLLKGFWANLLILPGILSLAMGVKLAYNGARQLLVIERLKNKQTESELKLLRSQINPHFLFNTLNNIYSTNLDEHDKANEIILQLADLLRYQLESNKKNKTFLADEIHSLESYITLEKIRVRDCKIDIEKNGNFSDVEIIPLILIPFVENAFKYGTGITTGDIGIKFDIQDNHLFTFYCKNKIVQSKGKVHSGGIGLDNVKKRLELMYSNKYDLQINENKNYFEVILKINL